MRTPCILRIIAPPRFPPEPGQEALFETLLTNLAKETDGQFAIECVGYGQLVHVLVIVDKTKQSVAQSVIFATYPDADVQTAEEYVHGADPRQSHIAGAVLTLKYSDIYPITMYADKQSVPGVSPGSATTASSPSSTAASTGTPATPEAKKISQLFTAMATTHAGDQLWLQVVVKSLHNTLGRNFKRKIQLWLSKFFHIFWIRDYFRPEGMTAIRLRRNEKAYAKGKLSQMKVNIRCASIAAKSHADARRQLEALLGAFRSFSKVDHNYIIARYVSDSPIFLHDYANRVLRTPYVLTTREIATLVFVPDPQIVPNIVHVLSRKAAPPQTLPKVTANGKTPRKSPANITALGETNYRNIALPFGITLRDRRRNMFIMGASGTGKETLQREMILSDIEQGHGIAIIDPHGQIIDDVLPHIPRTRAGDVLFLDPTDREHPIAFNPLDGIPDTLRVQFIQNLIRISKKLLGDAWTIDAEHLLSFTFSALLETKEASLLSFISLYQEEKYRTQIADAMHDSLAKSFWSTEFQKWAERSEAAAAMSAVLNKMGQLLSSPLLRDILGQPRSSFVIEDLIREQKIILWKVPKGVLGQEASMLLGSLFAARLGLSVVEKTNDEDGARDFHVYMDDFRSFVMENMTEMLKSSEQYALNFTLCDQSITDMDDAMQKTIFSNVGTLLTFRTGKEDAEQLVSEFSPPFDANDLMNLPNNDFYVKMEIAGRKFPPFSGRITPRKREPQVRVEDVRKLSQKQFGGGKMMQTIKSQKSEKKEETSEKKPEPELEPVQ